LSQPTSFSTAAIVVYSPKSVNSRFFPQNPRPDEVANSRKSTHFVESSNLCRKGNRTLLMSAAITLGENSENDPADHRWPFVRNIRKS